MIYVMAIVLLCSANFCLPAACSSAKPHASTSSSSSKKIEFPTILRSLEQLCTASDIRLMSIANRIQMTSETTVNIDTALTLIEKLLADIYAQTAHTSPRIRVKRPIQTLTNKEAKYLLAFAKTNPLTIQRTVILATGIKPLAIYSAEAVTLINLLLTAIHLQESERLSTPPKTTVAPANILPDKPATTVAAKNLAEDDKKAAEAVTIWREQERKDIEADGWVPVEVAE